MPDYEYLTKELEVGPGHTEEIKKLEEQGWRQNPFKKSITTWELMREVVRDDNPKGVMRIDESKILIGKPDGSLV